MIRPFSYRPIFQLRTYAQDFHIKRVMRLPKQHMYNVVGDVAKYSEFVPYCLESTVTKHGSDGSPTYAMLRVGWNQLDEKFESKVTHTSDQVLATAADNKMFKQLECEWTINELSKDQCSVALRLKFQFQNALYDFMAQNAGALVSKRMIEAFTKRAVQERKKQLK